MIRWRNCSENRDSVATEIAEYTPRSAEDLVGVIRRTPSSVLNAHQKKAVARALSAPDRVVADLMLPREQVLLVLDTEFLGPLTLDKLYKSGLSHFPVVDKDRHILGLLHTEALNSLEIREGKPAKEYVDRNVIYVRPDYLLTEALAVMLRTDRTFLVVIDNFERFLGVVTFATVVEALLGFVPEDNFKQDDSALAVAKRRLQED